MDVFVGTSGWYYDWNKKKNFDWFIENSSLNSVELNASFYRFPFPRQIEAWSTKGAGLRWSIKVHRSITHWRQLSGSSLEIWENFRELFEPMDHIIDFYLFQVPPNFNDVARALRFAEAAKLGERFALEIRNRRLLGDDEACEELMKEVTLVSVDSPDYRNRIFPGKIIYMRMHGREGWYNYNYSMEEISETFRKMREFGPEKVYIYFNNDHNMLENARMTLKVFSGL
ncbi:Uncharacterized conserved protein YecE, DUF72 family [Methanosarcina thermophila]|jgi:uncharacterized protein YecE (DUF72 family)|uniref:Uncharacterized conserved protein YecE, DUF72 family n=3 Tax=Methanosarcina thermophila TaxID=2210 RepID=A0A1I7AIP3_METTE|nr:DUF72 domain-containing protein [Methanosarcina thermophila]ALK06001.1 MAG: hypothetical protein AAY43_10245 [Methanosarcina sp. 795]AKB12419.1 hypothetical protein MSTHT_0661 [Methanosarcina thermophila TM-1]AKB14377.1 hypothetical protein MSTHC_0059 [Methanosarcina thermophila CHTI-55]NLU57931.1 DUF72 domain-containing protein [Methanosarcina thermophila]SFT74806.1 Uncharacterized conserved protein YecE, DUF72 family [Methanosarcina thermophila]